MRPTAPRSRCRLAWVVAPVLAAVPLACGTTASEESGDGASTRPRIVATTDIWADIASNVACDGLAEVSTVLPSGADPHTAELSLAARSDLDSADLVIANGLGIEGSLDDALEAAEAGGTPVLRVGEELDALEGDPHVWQDPIRVGQAVGLIAAALMEHTDVPQGQISTCTEEYDAELAALGDEIASMTSPIPSDRRVMVTNHPAMGHFADRFDLEVLGTVQSGGGSLSEASPADLEALAAEIPAAGVSVLFTEEGHPDTEARALAERLGLRVVPLRTDALGEPGSDADTYLGLMRHNAVLVSTALLAEPGGAPTPSASAPTTSDGGS